MSNKSTNIIDRADEYRELWRTNRQRGFRFVRLDYEDFNHFLKKSDLIMCKRNFYSAHNDFFILLSPECHLEAACVIKQIDVNNFYIKLFEVSEMNFGQGIGRLLFNKIVKFYSDNLNLLIFELESLDDDSTEFWKHLGFKEFENEDGEILMRKIIEF